MCFFVHLILVARKRKEIVNKKKLWKSQISSVLSMKKFIEKYE